MKSHRTRLAAGLCAVAMVAMVASSAFAVLAPAPRGPANTGAAVVAFGAQEMPGAFGAATRSSSVGYGRCAALAVVACAAAALIVQNKGGGHGEVGYHLALQLVKEKAMQVTMINDTAAKMGTPPFNSYADLEAAGVKVVMADLAGGGITAALQGVAPCEYVFDNQNVCTKDVQAHVKNWPLKAYAYVSSGGMYKPLPEGPLLETGDVKEDNKQLSLERNAASLGLPWSAYRPQYIYGPKTNKPEYLDWFFDRISRDVEFPLPIDGSMRTTVSNAIDVAGMMASVVGKEDAAKGQVFNCATDVRVSHAGVVGAVAKCLGKDPAEVMKKVKFYDPAKLKAKGVELPKGGKFPFRETHFGVGVDKAKQLLGWAPRTNLQDDCAWYYADYKARGKDTAEFSRDWDLAVIANA